MRHRDTRLRFRRGGRERPGEPAAVPVPEGITIGDLEGPMAVVDPQGTVHALDGAWRLEWGAAAENRWRRAADEVAVRQRRIDDAPVLETAMRIPGGDLVARVAAVADGDARALVVEVENDSGGPVASVVALRGAGAVRAGADGATLGPVTLRADRAVGGAVAAEVDPWPAVEAEPPPTTTTAEATVDGGVALIVALPHRQQVTFTVAPDGPAPTRVPTPDDVAAGWRAVTASAATIEVPDAAVGEAWRRLVPDLVVAAGSNDPELAAQAAWYLDIAGLHDEADRVRARIVVLAEAGRLRDAAAVAALLALASRDLRAGEPSGLDELAGPLVAAAGEALTTPVLEVVADALDDCFPAAAADARMLANEYGRGWWSPRGALIQAAGRVLSAVVEEDLPGGLSLLPEVPSTWWGGEIDVRGVKTLLGNVAFSVRWHGDRPALLWERVGGPDVVRLHVPGLDPGWGSDERRGEGLLAAPVAS